METPARRPDARPIHFSAISLGGHAVRREAGRGRRAGAAVDHASLAEKGQQGSGARER